MFTAVKLPVLTAVKLPEAPLGGLGVPLRSLFDKGINDGLLISGETEWLGGGASDTGPSVTKEMMDLRGVVREIGTLWLWKRFAGAKPSSLSDCELKLLRFTPLTGLTAYSGARPSASAGGVRDLDSGVPLGDCEGLATFCSLVGGSGSFTARCALVGLVKSASCSMSAMVS